MALREFFYIPICITLAFAAVMPPAALAAGDGRDYTPGQQAILESVVDFDLWRIDPGLGVLTQRAESIAAQPQANWPGTDSPDYQNLLLEPAHYRGRAISIKIQPIYLTFFVLPGTGNSSTGKKLWRLDGFVTGTDKPADQPVSIFLIANPAKTLGVTAPLDSLDEINCATGRPVTISGLFYKTYTDTSRGDHTEGPTERNYPVIIAWNFFSESTAKVITLNPASQRNWLVLGIVILLGAAYAALRVYTNRRAGKARASDLPDVKRGDGEVEPGLIQAAREYRKLKDD